MTTIDKLYPELKPDIALLAQPLLDLSEKLLREPGNFVPHAAVLTEDGEIKLVGAAPSNEITNSTEVLPLLHEGLRIHDRGGRGPPSSWPRTRLAGRGTLAGPSSRVALSCALGR